MVSAVVAPSATRRRLVHPRATLSPQAALHRGAPNGNPAAAAFVHSPAVKATLTAADSNHNSALRAIMFCVAWSTVSFVRLFVMQDRSFPIEAMLPAVYAGGCIFTGTDELRVFRLPFVVDTAIMSVAATLVLDAALGEVLLPALLVAFGLQYCRVRFVVAVVCGILYLGYHTLFGASPPGPRTLTVQFATITAVGITCALIARSNRILLGARTAAHHRVAGWVQQGMAYSAASPIISTSLRILNIAVLNPVRSVGAIHGVREALMWMVMMLVDWYYRVSIGGLIMSGCLLVGFGATLAQLRTGPATARSRHAYQLLLIVAVWTCDIAVFLSSPSRTLPFISNCVIAAYIILHYAAPSPRAPRVTPVANTNALAITPAPLSRIGVVVPTALWCMMVGMDLAVQLHTKWEEPSVGRVLVSVNTIGYGMLLLASAFLEAFSREARIRARLAYLDEEAVSADAVALRQLCDDLEGSLDIDASALTAATMEGEGFNQLLSDTRFSATSPDGAIMVHPHDDDDPHGGQEAADCDSHSDASTTAHGATTDGNGDLAKASSGASSRTPPESGSGSFTHAQPNRPAPPVETPEEAAERERQRLEADEQRRKARAARKAEESRLQDLRALEISQRRERLRREQEMKEVVDTERVARDVLLGSERTVRDALVSSFADEITAVEDLVRQRTQRDADRKANRAAKAVAADTTAAAQNKAGTAKPPVAAAAQSPTAAGTPKAMSPTSKIPAPPGLALNAAQAAAPPAKASKPSVIPVPAPPVAASASKPQAPAIVVNANEANVAPSVPVASVKAAKAVVVKTSIPLPASAAAKAAVVAPAAKTTRKDPSNPAANGRTTNTATPPPTEARTKTSTARGWEVPTAATTAAAAPLPVVVSLQVSNAAAPQVASPARAAPREAATPAAKAATSPATPAAVAKDLQHQRAEDEGDAINFLLAALHRNDAAAAHGAPTTTHHYTAPAPKLPKAPAPEPLRDTTAGSFVVTSSHDVVSPVSPADDDDGGEDLMNFINDQVNNVLKDNDHQPRTSASRRTAPAANDFGGDQLSPSAAAFRAAAAGVNPSALAFQSTAATTADCALAATTSAGMPAGAYVTTVGGAQYVAVPATSMPPGYSMPSQYYMMPTPAAQAAPQQYVYVMPQYYQTQGGGVAMMPAYYVMPPAAPTAPTVPQ